MFNLPRCIRRRAVAPDTGVEVRLDLDQRKISVAEVAPAHDDDGAVRVLRLAVPTADFKETPLAIVVDNRECGLPIVKDMRADVSLPISHFKVGQRRIRRPPGLGAQAAWTSNRETFRLFSTPLINASASSNLP